MFTSMEIDALSFFLGLALSGAAGGVLLWNEQCSLANRIAYACCEKARLLVNCKRELVVKSENIDPFDLESPAKIDGKIYPIENEEFKIVLLPSETVQSDVHISEYIGVYSKRHDLWLMIGETTAFLEDGIRDSCLYFFCKPNFEDKQFIKTPYSFNVGKFLIREKK